MPYYPCIHYTCKGLINYLVAFVSFKSSWLALVKSLVNTCFSGVKPPYHVYLKNTPFPVSFWDFYNVQARHPTFNVFQNVMHTRNLRAAWLGFYYVSRYHQHTPESAVFNPDTTVINIVSACRYICMWCISGLAIQQTYIWIH